MKLGLLEWTLCAAALAGALGLLTIGDGVRSGERADVTLDIGSLPPGDSLVIEFDVDVDVDPPFENERYELSAQGALHARNAASVVTDDPDTPEPNDPTLTIVHQAPPTPVVVSDLAAASDERGIVVRWTLSQEHVDELTGVSVQRADATSGPYRDRESELSRPARNGIYTDPHVVAGATYWYRLELHAANGTRSFTRPIRVTFAVANLRTHLDVPVAAIGKPVQLRYSIGASDASHVRLEIFNVAGRRIRVLENGPRPAGRYVAHWDRRSRSGQTVARGLYIVRLDANGKTLSRKLLVLE